MHNWKIHIDNCTIQVNKLLLLSLLKTKPKNSKQPEERNIITGAKNKTKKKTEKLLKKLESVSDKVAIGFNWN